MKTKALLVLSFILIINSFNQLSAQGRVDGFFKQKNQLDIALGYNYESNEKFYAGKDLVDLKREIYSQSLFVAYGLSDRLDVNVSIAQVEIGKERNLQDGAVFLKYLIKEKKLSKGKLTINLAAGYSTNLTDYQTEGSNAIGKQATSYDFRPMVHYMNENGFFSTFQVAAISNSDPTPNALNAAIKVGKAKGNYYFDLWYEYFDSNGGLDYRGSAQVLTFRELGTDFHKVGATLYKPIQDWLGAYIAINQIINGRNIGNGYSIGAGLVIKPLR